MGTWVPLGLHPFSNSLPGLGPGTLPGGCGPYPLRPEAQVLKEAEEEGNRVTTRPVQLNIGLVYWERAGGIEMGGGSWKLLSWPPTLSLFALFL